MGKIFRTRDKIILALALVGDLFEEARPSTPKEIFRSAFYNFGEGKREKSNFTLSLYRTLKTGNIEKIMKKGEVCFRITTAGRKRIVRDFPLLQFQTKKWDGRWRFVFFDIEEEEKELRNKLREKLIELGFGMIQKSIYISPFDVAEDLDEFINSLGLEDKAFVAVATDIFTGNLKLLVSQVWKLDEMNEEYENILFAWEKNKEPRPALYQKYLDVFYRDPMLPSELLPPYWLGDKARKVIKDYFKKK